jgi:hypothetical protein
MEPMITFHSKKLWIRQCFSIEVWIKPDPQPENQSSNIQTIISKRNANSLINGYDLRLVGIHSHLIDNKVK